MIHALVPILLFGSSAYLGWLLFYRKPRKASARPDAKASRAQEKLRRAFIKLRSETATEEDAKRAVTQTELLNERIALFERALASRMSPGEALYDPFFSAAQSVR